MSGWLGEIGMDGRRRMRANTAHDSNVAEKSPMRMATANPAAP
jgi:hypothetical protein